MVTCGRVPRHWAKSWTVWERPNPNYWQCVFASNDPAAAVENAAWRTSENIVMAPGERPVMPKGRCHRNTP